MWTIDPSVTVTVTVFGPAGVGARRFTVAVPGLLVAADVAVTVMGELGLGSAVGAVYRPPVWLIVPVPVPKTAQVTLWLVELLTVAVNCCCWAGAPAKLGYRVSTVCGLTVTETGGGELLPPPHATRNPVRAKARQSPTIL